MKIVTYAELKSGATMRIIMPYFTEELANTWRPSKAEIVRDITSLIFGGIGTIDASFPGLESTP
jgi:hypothetical protein